MNNSVNGETSDEAGSPPQGHPAAGAPPDSVPFDDSWIKMTQVRSPEEESTFDRPDTEGSDER